MNEALDLEARDELAPEFYVCACPCGCSAPSTLPWMRSVSLGRHARCSACGTDAHQAAHRALVTPVGQAAPVPRALTNLYVPTKAETDLAFAAQKEVRDEIWQAQWARWQASLPEKFKDANTEHPKVRERMRRLAAGERGIASMLILGAPGLGKTWLGVAYANAAIKAGYFSPSDVLFGSESELLASAANSNFKDVEPALRRLIAPRIKMIIIDDVGRGTWLNESMRAKVFSLVLDKFWSENRVVVFTSNLEPDNLGTYIGDGAMDRLKSLVGNSVVKLDSESKRRMVTEEMLARANLANVDGFPPTPPIPAV